MQRKRCAGRARQRMPPRHAKAAAPPCEPRSRAGRALVDNGSPGKPFLAQEVLSVLPIGGSFGRGPETPRNRC
eukprot:395664-Pyramimonas_sp.AAC.1